MSELYYNERRIDGRKPNELRKVISSVVGPHAPKYRSDGDPDRAVILVQFTKPPFCSTSGERRKLAQKDRSTNDFAAAIEEIFACVIRTDKYPLSQIEIFIEVLQSDGSEFSCAVNATALALTSAGIEMYHFISAATVGLWGSHIFADLCRFEENPRVSQLTVVCLFSTDKNQTTQSQILHTRLSTWLPVEKLNPLMIAGTSVAKALGNEFTYWLRGRVRESTNNV